MKSAPKSIAVELKVCESCGILWLRPSGHGVYCRRCVPQLAALPQAQPRPCRHPAQSRRRPPA